MINNKYLKLIREKKNYTKNKFIFEIIAKRIIDTLDLLKIDIPKALEIGINENKVCKYIENNFLSKIDRADVSLLKQPKEIKYKFFEISTENLLLEKNLYNLIYSNCFIHLMADFDKSLEEIYKSLKPNGLFIATIPDKTSMHQLLNSMYKADLYFYNGVYQRFNNTIEVQDALNILKKLKFDSPTIFSDTFNINYKFFSDLLKDVRNMNLTYCNIDKKQNFENKKYFELLEKSYEDKNANGDFNLEVKINIITAWKI